MAPTIGGHRDWTIRVNPRQDADHRWRALVEVWPPDRGPRMHNATVVLFARSAEDEQSVVVLGLAAARDYIAAR